MYSATESVYDVHTFGELSPNDPTGEGIRAAVQCIVVHTCRWIT